MFERCLYFNTNHLFRLTEKKFANAYSELNLAPAHAYLLRLVLQKPGIIQRDIALVLHLEKSTVTRFIKKMSEEGYLTKDYLSAQNLKSPGIYPTPKTQKIANRLNEIGDQLYASLQDSIDVNELSLLVESIKSASKKI